MHLTDKDLRRYSGSRAAHVTEASRQSVPELAFRKMRGMRNIVADDYANVDLRIVWEVAPWLGQQSANFIATTIPWKPPMR
jgi:uncharacterized protein with HEPN domain